MLIPGHGHFFGVADASGFVLVGDPRESTWSYSRHCIHVARDPAVLFKKVGWAFFVQVALLLSSPLSESDPDQF